MQCDTALFPSTDGVGLYLYRWRSKSSIRTRTSLVIVPGLKDHAGLYRGFAERIVEAGWVVYCADLRGYGRSEGGRAFTRFNRFVDDLKRLLRVVQEDEENLERRPFLWGHSVGGTIAVLTTLQMKDQSTVPGLVLSAAALKRDVTSRIFMDRPQHPDSYRPPVKWLDPDEFTRDLNFRRTLRSDPFVQDGPPVRTTIELVVAINQIHQCAHDLRVPLLALHGQADRITPADGTADFCGMVQSADKTLSIYPDLLHHMIHEPEGSTVQTEIAAWLNAHAEAR